MVLDLARVIEHDTDPTNESDAAREGGAQVCSLRRGERRLRFCYRLRRFGGGSLHRLCRRVVRKLGRYIAGKNLAIALEACGHNRRRLLAPTRAIGVL